MSQTKLSISVCDDLSVLDALKAVAWSVELAAWEGKPITKEVNMMSSFDRKPITVYVSIEHLHKTERGSHYTVNTKPPLDA